MTPVESDVRSRILETHQTTIEEVVNAGQTVADSWPDSTITDATVIKMPLEHVLRRAGLTDQLIALLGDAIRSTGKATSAHPVPAPPYLVVTSTGPICRATLSADKRLVIELVLFAVDRNPTRYRFLDPDPATSLEVTVH